MNQLQENLSPEERKFVLDCALHISRELLPKTCFDDAFKMLEEARKRNLFTKN